MTVAVTADPSAHRYQITTEGQLAGFTSYRDREVGGSSERIFFHTEVAPEFGGQGLATTLIEHALDDTRAQGRTIIAVCPLVAAFLKKHPDYAAASHPVTPDVLTWLDTELAHQKPSDS
ncbi:GNAT family N-acetyltransferase [Gordonia rhizosphera]|nr:GNAT family N-acetyltransferase [Gordonia rhizosphera]